MASTSAISAITPVGSSTPRDMASSSGSVGLGAAGAAIVVLCISAHLLFLLSAGRPFKIVGCDRARPRMSLRQQ
ncbi:hypothetical protein TL10_16055 [Mycolicibacterium llatzerense]|uniref:Uncharacterized protein n=1 Tax=Mycolicibacterium llatzerense TaxID=280871 RepID=A0A0D1JTV1_9MYCO|nr:hypothetical protein TL10_16055 [Mycolicibacterium llatzerense]MCT7368488.1 hypothetical protein [Mycolicibacterium llatzerense]